MPKHVVRMTEPAHDILNSDIDFWIWSRDLQLGHLHVSKGGIDWYDGSAYIKKRSLSWEDFRNILVRNVEETRAAKPKNKR